MTKERKQPEHLIARGISMRPVQYRVLGDLAVAAGHLSRSRVVQRLIDREAAKTFGDGWEERYEKEEGAA